MDTCKSNSITLNFKKSQSVFNNQTLRKHPMSALSMKKYQYFYKGVSF